MRSRVLEARYATYAPDFPEQVRTHAQKSGIAYEAAVIKRLRMLHPTMTAHPWLYYKIVGKSGICQPDALVWLDQNHLLIVEVKLSWVRGVRSKLLDFYGPIVQHIHPNVDLSYLQVYKNTKPGAHKRRLSLYELDTITKGAYKECQHLT